MDYERPGEGEFVPDGIGFAALAIVIAQSPTVRRGEEAGITIWNVIQLGLGRRRRRSLLMRL